MAANPWLSDHPDDVKVTLTDMCYNLGFHGLMSFHKMWAALKAGDYIRAAGELKDSKYFKQTGQRAEYHYEVFRTLGLKQMVEL